MAVLIEAKQSSLSLASKLSGDVERMKQDFNVNVLHAVEQLEKTENAIGSELCKELLVLGKIKHFQKVVVLYSPLCQCEPIAP